MADKLFKINEAIKVYYQAPAKETGLTVNMKVFDEADAEDVAQSGAMTELGTSGVYWKAFTPDAEGDWRVEVAKADGSGAVTKHYSIGSTDLPTVGGGITAIQNAVDTIETKVDAIDLELDGLQSPPMIG